jgi:uncharacterized protein
MRDIILEKLSAIEQDHNVSILYACESGSRAWGFASPDSDYDVRFIYTRPLNDYLSIYDKKDVIELPVNEVLDIGGWDVRKALQLLLKSNATLYEWLQSPIVYMNDSTLRDELLAIAPEYFSGRAGCHHYLSLTRNTFEYDLQGEQVRIKKYFYALRPLLAAQWIIERNTVPPMVFDKLRTLVTDNKWQQTVDDLMVQKQAANEKHTIPAIPLLQDWIADMMARCKEKADQLPALQHDTSALNILFRKFIR